MPYGSVLRIEIVRNKDSGSNFTCVAENGVGKPAKSTGHLKVYRIDRDGGNGKKKWILSMTVWFESCDVAS